MRFLDFIWGLSSRPFERRVFAAISCGTFLVGSVLLGVLVFRYNQMARSDLVERYLQSVRATGSAIRDYERESTRFMLNSLYLVREIDKREGIPSNKTLQSLASETGVTSLFVIGANGEFIRSTEAGPKKIPNFFSYCPLHEQLFTGEAADFATPLIPGSQGVPHKFVSIPNSNGKLVLHAAQRANFLWPLLQQTFFHENDVDEIAIFSPNGTVLTRYRRDGDDSLGDIDTAPYIEIDSKVEDVGQALLISHWVQSQHYVCCQCVFSDNTRKKLYDYLVQVRVSKKSIQQATTNLMSLFFISEIVLSLISFIVAKLIASHLASRLNSIRTQVMNRETDGPPIQIEGRDEISELADSFNVLAGKLERAQKELASVEKERAIAELASQVVHDIRSPLAALNMATRDVEHLAEKDKTLIRSAVSGITDILNVLDARGEKALILLDGHKSLSPHLSSLLLGSAISEKRVQFKDRPNVRIGLSENGASYGFFVKVDPTGFKRVFSNLLNNAAESIEQHGIVKVEQRETGGWLEIVVQDNGKGIPPDVLPKIGEKNFSFGKPNGTGLGIYGARKFIQSWGGELSVSSAMGAGTTITVRLPLSAPPSWFASVLSVEKGQAVVVLDDDESVHHIWKRRFNELDPSIDVVTLHSSKQLGPSIKNREGKDLLFLVDQELSKTGKTGLQIIEALGIASNSVLVTSRFSDTQIQKDCARLKLRMLPKSLVSFVPIRCELQPRSKTSTFVLIDDSASWRDIWERAARKKGVTIRSFRSTAEFLDRASEFRLDETVIYIDSDLGKQAPSGEITALKIFGLGFREIYLTTGHSAIRFHGFWWIRGVIGKAPPF